MRIKHLFILILALIMPYTNAQNQKSTKTKPSIPEIDRLYNKYKNSDIITLYTSHGDLYGDVSVEMNDNEKPVSITISGDSDDKPAIAEFISNTIKMKINQGYKVTRKPELWGYMSYAEVVLHGLGWTFNGENSFQLEMRKGNMYFTASAGLIDKTSINSSTFEVSTKLSYQFEIITGDLKRKGGNSAEKFEF